VIFTTPVPGFISVIGLAGFLLTGVGISFVPSLPLCVIQFSLFFPEELIVWNQFFHPASLLHGFRNPYGTSAKTHKQFVNPLILWYNPENTSKNRENMMSQLFPLSSLSQEDPSAPVHFQSHAGGPK
jgi:hypothetical protein